VKLALVAPAAIVTEAGAVTALLLLNRLTVVAVVAAEVSVTVQASVPAPVSDPLLQETALSVAGACPVPFRLMVAVAALLLIATDPVNEAAVAGSKLIVNAAVCPGFSVTGKLIPESANPVPVTAAALIVSAAVPDEVRVTVLLAAVFSARVPNATLVLLTVSPGAVAFSASAKVFETPPDVAVSVTVWLEVTAAAVAVKLALVAPAAIVTEAGTVTALLLLDRVTAVALAAAPVRLNVQPSVPAPASELLVQDTAFRVAAVLPLPLQNVAICITHPPVSFRVDGAL